MFLQTQAIDDLCSAPHKLLTGDDFEDTLEDIPFAIQHQLVIDAACLEQKFKLIFQSFAKVMELVCHSNTVDTDDLQEISKK